MRVVILANVPVWTLPGLEHLHHTRHYATWLEPLIPAFQEAAPDLDLHWITMCKETRVAIIHKAHGQTFHILPRGKMAISMVTGYLGEILKIRRIIKRLNPDLVHAWGSEDVYGLAGAFSGIDRRIFTLQGSLTEYLRLLGGSLLFRLQTCYEKPTVLRYHHATAESPGAANLLKQLNPSLDVKIVDYGVNAEFFNATWKPAPNPEVLFLGSVSRRKGVVDLIEIAKRPEMSHIRFKIAGEGELRTELQGNSPPNVEWLGKCTRQEVIRHLESAWALFIPTYSDTGPTVIKEARIVGLPIITTTGAGASSYVKSTECGFVTEPGDRDLLAKAVLSTCSDRDTCISLGKRHWEQHRQDLHPTTTALNFTEIYKEVYTLKKTKS